MDFLIQSLYFCKFSYIFFIIKHFKLEVIWQQKEGSSNKTLCCGCSNNINQLIIITLPIISCDLKASHWRLMMTDPASVIK